MSDELSRVSLADILVSEALRDATPLIAQGAEEFTLGEVNAEVDRLATVLRHAGVLPGQAVGVLVSDAARSVVAMFAIWAVRAVYVPINARLTDLEIAEFIAETPVVLVVGAAEQLARQPLPTGLVEYGDGQARVVAPSGARGGAFDADVALVLRTSGTTGAPKAVLLRHSGTLSALDASIAKLRGRPAGVVSPRGGRGTRINLIAPSLGLWAGIFNTLFAFRAGASVVLMPRFSTVEFAELVRRHTIRSTVLAPAMISMLADDERVTDLAPLRLVRSITAPLVPQTAERFFRRFGVFVLNSYGQTELGGEVVGWTASDVNAFGTTKLGAAGRPYDDVDLRVRGAQSQDLPTGEVGEIWVRSPFLMHGYAAGSEQFGDRLVDGYLRTGDLGWLDEDGFLWVQGRVSDMINRGGLKVSPEEVEAVLRCHPAVVDACVAAVPDQRLGEVPHAWLIVGEDVDDTALTLWLRDRIAAYKVPTGFTRVPGFPRSEIGKVLRRELVRGLSG
jgi:long-chain acyl-CoA synthetase